MTFDLYSYKGKEYDLLTNHGGLMMMYQLDNCCMSLHKELPFTRVLQQQVYKAAKWAEMLTKRYPIGMKTISVRRVWLSRLSSANSFDLWLVNASFTGFNPFYVLGFVKE